MKLNEALKAAGAARELSVRRQLFLVCGFEPLHLPVFLQAHHVMRFPGHALDVRCGLYGDLEGNLARALESDATVAAVTPEWSDLDSRLGLRSTGTISGSPEQLTVGVQDRLDRLLEAIQRLSARMPVVLSAPTLPPMGVGQTSGWQSSPLELELERMLARFLESCAGQQRVQVLAPHRLAALSPSASRRDPRLELAAGFPFSTEHASVLASALLQLAYPPAPKKGLITDLDDTMWAGLVGEIGVDAIAWGQADHAQVHGLYQSALCRLADAGVLLAVASKNEPAVVDAALERQDLLIDKQAFFPITANWGPKSATVSAILGAWNIGADAVVVVDDSRMELEEIRSVHPEIHCLEFTPKDPARCLLLLEQLSDLFGKPVTLDEDRLRSTSVRQRAIFEQQKPAQDMASFLSGLAGKVSFDGRKNPNDSRVLELINKTNQWNLNGLRISEGEWLRLLSQKDSFVLSVSYEDRYGSLGKIAVMAGVLTPEAIVVEHWVLSCRAFSRRIEDHMLRHLFTSKLLGPAPRASVRLRYRRTDKNMPLREFLTRLGVATQADGPVDVLGEVAAEVGRGLPHAVHDTEPPELGVARTGAESSHTKRSLPSRRSEGGGGDG